MRVFFTPAAVRQLDNLHGYITASSGEKRADVYIGRIEEFCEGLDTFPLRGMKRDDLLPGLRIIGFQRRAVIAFVATADTVTAAKISRQHTQCMRTVCPRQFGWEGRLEAASRGPDLTARSA